MRTPRSRLYFKTGLKGLPKIRKKIDTHLPKLEITLKKRTTSTNGTWTSVYAAGVLPSVRPNQPAWNQIHFHGDIEKQQIFKKQMLYSICRLHEQQDNLSCSTWPLWKAEARFECLITGDCLPGNRATPSDHGAGSYVVQLQFFSVKMSQECNMEAICVH